MTILEGCSKLHTWFSQHDIYTEQNIKDVMLISENAKEDRATLRGALQELENLKIVNKQTIDNITYWILQRPFSQIEQNLAISGPVAGLIAQTINEFCEIVENNENLCNPLNIQEKDITFLLFILSQIKKTVQSKDT